MKQRLVCLVGTALLAIILLATPGIPATDDGGGESCIPPGMFFNGMWVNPEDNGIFGTDGADRLEGTEGCDYISGEGGKDVIRGFEGKDHLIGGPGRDLIFGGKGLDFIFGGHGRDRIFGGRGDDYLDGSNGNDYIEGNQGDDEIWGELGQDHLIGGKGDDILLGGQGDDRLRGGSGSDLFVFWSAHGEDTILDFQDGIDKIRLCLDGIKSFNDLGAVRDSSVGDDGQFIHAVITAYFREDESGVAFDLTRFGGGEIYIRDLDYSAFGSSDVEFCPRY